MTDIKVLTSHSEYLPLDSMYINPVSNAFINVSNIAAQWKPLNFLSPPNYLKAIEEYAGFEAILKEYVSDIHYFQKDKNLSLDAMYCRDASIATDHGMILCNMGKAMRSMEPNAQDSVYEAAGIPILGRIEAPGTLEGGDVAWIDTQTLAVGHSYRTNHAGIEQLKGLLNPLGIDVLVVELPHFRGPSDVFHLMSVLSPVDADLAVVYSPLMPIKFRNELWIEASNSLRCRKKNLILWEVTFLPCPREIVSWWQEILSQKKRYYQQDASLGPIGGTRSALKAAAAQPA